MIQRGAVSLLLAVSVGVVGCSQDAPQLAPDSAPTKRRSSEGHARPASKAGGSKAGRQGGEGSTRDGSSDGSSGASDASGSDDSSSGSNSDGGSSSGAGTGGGGEQTGSSSWAMRSDPPGDDHRQGQAPTYSDIRKATISGPGSTISFTLETDASPPQRLAEGIDMTARFHFKMSDGEEHHIYAMGGKKGWKPDLDNSGEFPGRFELDGNRFVFELPWTRLGGPSSFKWLAQTSWTRWPEDDADDPDFAFDQVPEYQKASYPE